MSSLIIVTILMAIPLAIFIGNEILDYYKSKKENIQTFIKLHDNKVELKNILEESKKNIENSVKMLKEIEHKP